MESKEKADDWSNEFLEVICQILDLVKRQTTDRLNQNQRTYGFQFTILMKSCDRRKCFYCLFIAVECILLRFPTYIIGSILAEIANIENSRISN